MLMPKKKPLQKSLHRNRLLLSLFACASVLQSARADQSVPILHINDDIEETPLVRASVELNADGNLQALKFSNLPAAIPLDQLKRGVTTMTVGDKANGQPILKLQANVGSPKADGFDPTHGGILTMTYLQNGIKGAYKTFQLEIVRVGNDWMVRDPKNHQPCSQLFMKANRIGFGKLSKVIGIDKVELKSNASTIEWINHSTKLFAQMNSRNDRLACENETHLSKQKFDMSSPLLQDAASKDTLGLPRAKKSSASSAI